MFRRFLKQLDDQINLKLLSKIVLVLLIVYLLKMTFPLWGNVPCVRLGPGRGCCHPECA